jgi:hypothetical protein
MFLFLSLVLSKSAAAADLSWSASLLRAQLLDLLLHRAHWPVALWLVAPLIRSTLHAPNQTAVVGDALASSVSFAHHLMSSPSSKSSSSSSLSSSSSSSSLNETPLRNSISIQRSDSFLANPYISSSSSSSSSSSTSGKQFDLPTLALLLRDASLEQRTEFKPFVALLK